MNIYSMGCKRPVGWANAARVRWQLVPAVRHAARSRQLRLNLRHTYLGADWLARVKGCRRLNERRLVAVEHSKAAVPDSAKFRHCSAELEYLPVPPTRFSTISRSSSCSQK